MPTLYSPGNATTLLNEYAAKYYKNSNSGITSGDLSSPNYGVQSRGGGGFQLQRSPSTNTSNPLPYKESGSLTLRTRNPQQLNIRKPLNLKPPSPAQTQQGGISNALNRSLNFHRQQQAFSGNRTSTSGPRGTTQAAKNINNFGSTRGNVASNSGTATVNNAYTPGQRSSAIQRWNAAANKTTSAPRTTTSPGQFAKQQGAQAITQATGTVILAKTKGAGAAGAAGAGAAGAGAAGAGGGLFAPVAANPAGVVAALGTAALGGGLFLGDKIYGAIGKPFGPSVGDHLNSLLGRNPGNDTKAVAPKSSAKKQPGDIVGDDTYGDDSKHYYVLYRTHRRYMEPHSRADEGWIDLGTDSIVARGPIGTVTYSSGGNHKYIGVTSPDGASSTFEPFAIRNIIAGTGTSNSERIDMRLEIEDVIELDNEGDNNGSVDPNEKDGNPARFPPPSDLPDLSPNPDKDGDGKDEPTGYDPAKDLDKSPNDAPNNLPTQDQADNINNQDRNNARKAGLQSGGNSSGDNQNSNSPNKHGLNNNKTSPPPSNNTAQDNRINPDFFDTPDPTNPSKQSERKLGNASDSGDSIHDKLLQRLQNSGTDSVSFSNFIPALAMPALPNRTNALNPPKQGVKTNPPVTTKGSGCGCNGGINAHTDNALSGLEKRLSDKLNDIPDLSLLAKIDTTTTATAGIVTTTATVVNTIQTLTKKTWDFLQIDRLLAVANFAMNLHNAYFLSRELAETAGWAIDSVMRLFGLHLEDSEGNPIGVSEKISELITSAIDRAIGEAKREEIAATLTRANRIYQAASNLYWSMWSIFDSGQMIVETIGQNVARIGNALRRSGTVLENAYGAMSERFDRVYQTGKRWEALSNRIDRADEAVSAVGLVADELVSIQEVSNELQEQRAELRAAIKTEGELVDDPWSEPLTEAEAVSKAASQAPHNLDDPSVGGV